MEKGKVVLEAAYILFLQANVRIFKNYNVR